MHFQCLLLASIFRSTTLHDHEQRRRICSAALSNHITRFASPLLPVQTINLRKVTAFSMPNGGRPPFPAWFPLRPLRPLTACAGQEGVPTARRCLCRRRYFKCSQFRPIRSPASIRRRNTRRQIRLLIFRQRTRRDTRLRRRASVSTLRPTRRRRRRLDRCFGPGVAAAAAEVELFTLLTVMPRQITS